MKQGLKTLFLAISLFAAPADGTILQSDSLDFLEKQIARLDKRDLVVFDMDEVLIVPQDAILHFKVEDQRQGLQKKYVSHLDQHEQIHLFSCVWKNAKTQLVEPHIPQLIDSLQKRGVKVIVLTAAQVGRFGLIEDTVSFRIQELKEKGISLHLAFPKIATLVLEDLNQGKGSPVFCQGVMLSHRFPKGKVLANFLTQINWKPRRLIFIDDLRVNHESVDKELNRMGVEEVQCWHYTAAEKHAKKVNPEIAHLQIRTLVEQGIWLSDEEAKQLLP